MSEAFEIIAGMVERFLVLSKETQENKERLYKVITTWDKKGMISPEETKKLMHMLIFESKLEDLPIPPTKPNKPFVNDRAEPVGG